MTNNLEKAINFVTTLKKNKVTRGILQIVLFGSVARVEDTAESDIDIAIIYDGDKFDIMQKINRFAERKIQLTYLSLKELPKELEIVSALSGEGNLLWGKPLNVKLQQKELQPKVLISYDLSHLNKADQMKINRALHGGVSISRYKGKVYKTIVAGMVAEQGIKKYGRSVLIVERRKYAKVSSLFTRFNVSWKEMDIWTP